MDSPGTKSVRETYRETEDALTNPFRTFIEPSSTNHRNRFITPIPSQRILTIIFLSLLLWLISGIASCVTGSIQSGDSCTIAGGVLLSGFVGYIVSGAILSRNN